MLSHCFFIAYVVIAYFLIEVTHHNGDIFDSKFVYDCLSIELHLFI